MLLRNTPISKTIGLFLTDDKYASTLKALGIKEINLKKYIYTKDMNPEYKKNGFLKILTIMNILFYAIENSVSLK